MCYDVLDVEKMKNFFLQNDFIILCIINSEGKASFTAKDFN